MSGTGGRSYQGRCREGGPNLRDWSWRRQRNNNNKIILLAALSTCSLPGETDCACSVKGTATHAQ